MKERIHTIGDEAKRSTITIQYHAQQLLAVPLETIQYVVVIEEDANLRLEVARRMRESTMVVLMGYIAICAFAAVMYLVVPPVEPGGAFFLLNATATLVFVAIRMGVARTTGHWFAWFHRWAALAGIFYGLGFVMLTGEPQQTVVLVIVILSMAYVLPDPMTTTFMTVLSIGCWFVIGRNFPVDIQTHWAINLVSASAVSIIITANRHHTLVALAHETSEARSIRQELEVQAETLKSARDAAVAATREKNRFLATVSHEIRTPLHSIVGATELLSVSSLSDEQRMQLETTRDSALSMLAVINDLIDVARIEEGRFEVQPRPFAPQELLGRIGRQLEPLVRAAGLELSLDLATDLPKWLLGDGARIRQVLLNLCGNAIKFTSQGVVTVRVQIKELNGVTHLQVRVEDTGSGIGSVHADDLFEPFVRGDDFPEVRSGGSGLGLSICKRLVEGMGGMLGAEDLGDEKGAAFFFSVPVEITTDPGEPSEPSLPQVPAVAGWDDDDTSDPNRPHVLVVEDNLASRDLTVRIIERLGCRASALGDGASAVEAVLNAEYDLVLMDCDLPVMTGWEATEAIRAVEEGHRTPIVAMTGQAMVRDRERAARVGMDEHLAKPVTMEQFNRVLVRYARGPRQLRPVNDKDPSAAPPDK